MYILSVPILFKNCCEALMYNFSKNQNGLVYASVPGCIECVSSCSWVYRVGIKCICLQFLGVSSVYRMRINCFCVFICISNVSMSFVRGCIMCIKCICIINSWLYQVCIECNHVISCRVYQVCIECICH